MFSYLSSQIHLNDYQIPYDKFMYVYHVMYLMYTMYVCCMCIYVYLYTLKRTKLLKCDTSLKFVYSYALLDLPIFCSSRYFLFLPSFKFCVDESKLRLFRILFLNNLLFFVAYVFIIIIKRIAVMLFSLMYEKEIFWIKWESSINNLGNYFGDKY